MPKPIDLTLLRPGVKVKLKGSDTFTRKPWPLGWHEVAQIDPPFDTGAHFNVPARAVKVTSDHRWLPVGLIEEIAP